MSDIDDEKKKMKIFSGQGALEFHIENIKHVEREVVNIFVLLGYMSRCYVISAIRELIKEIIYKEKSLNEKQGISMPE